MARPQFHITVIARPQFHITVIARPQAVAIHGFMPAWIATSLRSSR
jgi:hypothetical protein